MMNKAAVSEDIDVFVKNDKSLPFKINLFLYLNALIVSVLPIWVFWRIFYLDLNSNAILLSVVTAVSTYAITHAYRSVQFVLKYKFARNNANLKKNNSSKASNDDKKLGDYDAITFSLFFINATFFALILISCLIFFKNFTPSIRYILTLILSDIAVVFMSSGTNFVHNIV